MSWVLQRGIISRNQALAPAPGGGGGGGTWTPASLSVAPLTWIDASNAGSITSSGSRISQINDLSGNAKHWTQATSGKQPLLVASQYNGLSTIRFDRTRTDNLKSLVVTNSRMMTFQVLSDVVIAANERFLSAGTGAGPDYGSANNFCIASASGPTVFNFSVSQMGSALSYTSSTLMIVAAQFDGNASFDAGIWKDGTAGTFTTHANPIITDNIIIGEGIQGGDCFNGDQCEVLILGYMPTTTDRQKIEGYLAWKWGTQASLPGGHPYAGAAP